MNNFWKKNYWNNTDVDKIQKKVMSWHNFRKNFVGNFSIKINIMNLYNISKLWRNKKIFDKNVKSNLLTKILELDNISWKHSIFIKLLRTSEKNFIK